MKTNLKNPQKLINQAKVQIKALPNQNLSKSAMPSKNQRST
jgi:hypothetical protein